MASPNPLPPISTELTNLLNELDLPGRIPRLFAPGTFQDISLLRSRLAYFLSEYETAPDAAVAFLREGTRRVLEAAVADILADIDRVLVEAL